MSSLWPESSLEASSNQVLLAPSLWSLDVSEHQTRRLMRHASFVLLPGGGGEVKWGRATDSRSVSSGDELEDGV